MRFNGEAHRGVRRRHGRLGAARQRHPLRRPLVQVSPPARHLQPRHRGAQRAAVGRSRAAAASIRTTARPCIEAVDGLSLRSQNHWPSLGFDVGAVNDVLAPLFAAGFYYKTFMWPRVVLGQALRAGDPRRGGSRPGARRARSRPLPAPPRALRRAGGRRRAGRACGGAGGVARAASGSSSPTSRRRWAARCCTTRPPASTASRRGTGSRTRWPSWARATTSRCCRAPPPSATTITTTSAWCSA